MWFESEEGIGSTFYFTIVTEVCTQNDTFNNEENHYNSNNNNNTINLFSPTANLSVNNTNKNNIPTQDWIVVIDESATLLEVYRKRLSKWGYPHVVMTQVQNLVNVLTGKIKSLPLGHNTSFTTSNRKPDSAQQQLDSMEIEQRPTLDIEFFLKKVSLILVDSRQDIPSIHYLSTVKPLVIMGYNRPERLNTLPFLKKPIHLATLHSYLSAQFFKRRKSEDNNIRNSNSANNNTIYPENSNSNPTDTHDLTATIATPSNVGRGSQGKTEASSTPILAVHNPMKGANINNISNTITPLSILVAEDNPMNQKVSHIPTR